MLAIESLENVSVEGEIACWCCAFSWRDERESMFTSGTCRYEAVTQTVEFIDRCLQLNHQKTQVFYGEIISWCRAFSWIDERESGSTQRYASYDSNCYYTVRQTVEFIHQRPHLSRRKIRGILFAVLAISGLLASSLKQLGSFMEIDLLHRYLISTSLPSFLLYCSRCPTRQTSFVEYALDLYRGPSGHISLPYLRHWLSNEAF